MYSPCFERYILKRWAPIPDYEDLYEISTSGDVRRVAGGQGTSSGKILKWNVPTRYPMVTLCKGGKRKLFYVHRLVLMSFVGCPEFDQVACHNNGDVMDCRLENLRWDTQKANIADSITHGTFARGSFTNNTNLKECDVRSIKQRLKLGERNSKLAAEYGVSRATITRIKQGIRWGHV